MTHSPLSGLAQIIDARSKRISSYDRTGGNSDCQRVPKGETAVLAQIAGAGVVKHMWFTLSSKDPMARRNLVLRMYWDGCEHPSVECPLGDFFGQGWGEKYEYMCLPLAATPANGNALVCYFPMPFGDGARIELENQGSEDVDSLYFYIDYEEHPRIGDEVGRFHAWYNQEITLPESTSGDRENEWATLGETPLNASDAHNYLFCECEGKGHFVGVHYFVNCPSPIWYGEGDDMFLVDGESWPGSAHGTGTEDYFNMSWCPDTVYLHPYFGCARAPGRGNNDPRAGWLGRTHCYRFHLEDPVRFSRSLRASIEHGHANTLTLEMASVAYWYQTMPGKRFPELPSAEERQPKPLVGVVDIHRWRDAWRQMRGGKLQWGNEV